jgi:CDP-glycerol glycerophosphotransferase (TagB/SpsB family)
MFILLLLFFLLLAEPTHAYLDPGTGSYLIQILIAVFVGSSYFVASSWGKLKDFFKNLYDKKGKQKQTVVKTTQFRKRKTFAGRFLLLREFSDFWTLFKTLPKEQKKIVFYSEHKGYYPYFEGLINYLTNKKKQNICYISSEAGDPIFQIKNKKINPFYLNKLLPFFMAYADFKVFLMTLTDLNQFHLKRSVKPVHYVYVFHSMVSTHMMYREGAFDYYDSMLCVGPHQIKEIIKYEKKHKLKAKKLVKAGYYRLERIHDAYKKYLKTKRNKKQKTVLIAPSWGDKNILEVVGVSLINKLITKKYKVICRPHPEIIKRTPEIIAEIKNKFGKNKQFVFEETIETDSSLLEADILITDTSGIALEYAFGTQRPVLFLDVPPKVKNPEYRKLAIEPIELSLKLKIGKVVSPKKIDNIDLEINKLIAQEKDYKRRILNLRDKYLFSFGKSSEIGSDYLVKLLKNGKSKKK